MASGATFLVVASEWDEAAQRFAERHRARGVQLLTPRDLSRTGWNYSLDRMGERSQAVVMGGLLAGSHIDGVLTRLACVREQDLPHERILARLADNPAVSGSQSSNSLLPVRALVAR
jgi:hypothetical protein